MRESIDSTVWQRTEVARSLRILHGDRPFEVRILGIPGRGKPHGAAGYFNDVTLAAECVVQFDRERTPAATYTVMNAINPALLARSPNRVTEFAEKTATDRDILSRQWMLVDIDPVRPAGVSSSDPELDEARRRAEDVHEYLRDRGFPEPVFAESGNGIHLLYPVALPNDDASEKSIGKTLKTLQKRFGADSKDYRGCIPVDVDTTVSNAARITKLYGTWTRKGFSIPERPHRLSRLTYVPDFLEAGL